MLILRWGYLPNEVRLALQPILVQYLWILPGWCRTLRLDYHLSDNGADASTSGEFEYRQARIHIHGGWLDGSPSIRRAEIIHELLHIPLLPMVDNHNEDIGRLFEDSEAPKFKATLEEQWRKSFEGAVQDLAYSILQIPTESLPIVHVIEEEDEHPPLKVAG